MYTPFLISGILVLWGAIFCNAEPLPHHIVLREDIYELFYDYNEENVTFEVHVATNGYFGFGISPNGGMAGADIVIGWVKDGEVFFRDRHAIRNAMPIIDEKQDWILEFGSENDTHTVMRFHRPIENCDPEDMDITDTTTRLIWSYGLEDPTGEDSVFYHGADRRGTKSVQLLNAMLTLPQIPEDAISVDLRVQNVTDYSRKQNSYWCDIVEIPEMDTDHHLIMYEPVITPGNEAYVHHMVAYMCPQTMKAEDVGTGKPFATDNMPQGDMDAYKGCYALLLSWAVGGENFYYPENAGVRIGPSNPLRYLRLEIHYDNPWMKNDIIDSSGFRIWLTPTLRKYDAGILLAGMMAHPMQIIPYNANDFMSRGHCPQECLSEVLGKDQINVFGAMGHTHLIGNAVKVRHFRNKVEMPPIIDDQHYDFNFQEYVHLKEEVVVQGTDSIMVDCHYNTMHKKNVTFGGLGTYEEMCCTFLLYYPLKKLSYCDSHPTPLDVLKSMNVEAEFVATPPWYNVTAPEKYVNQGIFEIVEDIDWNDVELQKNVEKASGSGMQFITCTQDYSQSYKVNFKTLFINESELTYREEEKSCKEHDGVEATKDPGDGTNGASARALSSYVIVLTLNVLLLG